MVASEKFRFPVWNFEKRETPAKMFFLWILKIFKDTFFWQNTSGWLLLLYICELWEWRFFRTPLFSDIALDITMILLIYCKWNKWWGQFSISVWHRDLDIGPIRPLMSSWHHHYYQRYPAQRNPLGSCTTSVSATIMPHLYCDTGNYSFRQSFSQLLLRNICKITPSNAALLKNNF